MGTIVYQQRLTQHCYCYLYTHTRKLHAQYIPFGSQKYVSMNNNFGLEVALYN